ncbi:MAG: YeeE/YedE family protein [Parvularculaceae bacterium]
MSDFDPVSALAGGAMIGLAATLLMLLNGRIAGVSGIVDGVLAPAREGFSWRLAFVAGLIAAPLAYAGLAGAPPAVGFPHPLWMVAAGGLFVGFGTQLGSGCTSGHGVCGLARLSKRSFAATATFIASAIAVVFVAHQFLGA